MENHALDLTKSTLAHNIRKKPIYNPNLTPANVTVAENHGKAFRFYESHTSTEKCPCCGLHIDGVEFDLLTDLKDLYNVGPGYSLYFMFFKYCIYLLLLVFLLSGLYGIITNRIGDDCSHSAETADFCVQDFVITYALCNKRQEKSLLTGQLALNFVVLIALAILFEQLRRSSLSVQYDFDVQNFSPSSYTLRLDGVPSKTSNEDLIFWLQSLGNSDNFPIEVKKITRTYKIHEFVELSKKKTELDKMKTIIEKKESNLLNGEEMKKTLTIKPKIQRKSILELKTVIDSLKQIKKSKVDKGSIVFASFETIQQARYVKKKLIPSSLLFKFITSIFPFLYRQGTLGGLKIKISDAPEPGEIIWENVGEKPEKRLRLRIVSYILTVLLIGFCFMIVFFIQWAQVASVEQYGEKSVEGRFISFASSIAIVILNISVSEFLRKIARYQKHSTFEKYLSSATIRLAIVLLINSAFITLFAKLILGSKYSYISGREIDKLNFYGPNGLLEGIIFVFISNALSTPILSFINFKYFISFFSRKKLKKQPDNNDYTQEEANKLFENPVFDMTQKYADLFQKLFIAFFYAPALPVCLLLTMGGLLLGYWVDKFLFLKRNGKPRDMNHTLNNSMVETLEWVGFMFAAGNIAFSLSLPSKDGENSFTGTAKGLIWVTLAFSLLHIIIPMEFFVKYFFSSNRITPEENSPYSVAKKNFKTDYDLENPVTRRAALKYWIKGEEKIFYLPSEEEDWNSLNLFAQREAMSTYNKLIVGGNNPLVRKDFKIEMLLRCFKVADKEEIAKAFARVYIGDALPEEAKKEIEKKPVEVMLNTPHLQDSPINNKNELSSDKLLHPTESAQE